MLAADGCRNTRRCSERSNPEQRFKGYYDELRSCLSDFERFTSTISPTTLKALGPHVATVEAALRPGMVALRGPR